MSAHRPTLSRPVRWSLYAAIVALAAFGVWYFSRPSKPANRWGPNPAWAGTDREPAIPVRVVAAERRDLPIFLKAIGTVTPLNTATVRSRVEGLLLRLTFDEGQQVEKGQLLAEIDPQPYRIQLAEAEGQQRQNAASLATARADLQRLETLSNRNLVTAQELDTQRALVAEREGAVAADQARVDEARLQLAYTKVEAPISGRIGLRRVDLGNLIRANDTNGIAVITQMRPIGVMLTIPETEIEKVVEPLRGGGQLAAEAWDRTERTRLARGVIRTTDNQIDLATGTLKLKAEFPNEDEKLFPNQFVNVRLQVATQKQAVIIPAAAVQFGSRGTYVYVVTPDNKSTLRNVELGDSDGVSQVVTKGLEPGEAVVLEGLDRLREGRVVVVVTDDGLANLPPKPAAPGPQKK